MEQSLDVNLCNNAVRFCFPGCILLPDVIVTELSHSMVVLVATNKTVHRLSFPHPTKLPVVTVRQLVLFVIWFIPILITVITDIEHAAKLGMQFPTSGIASSEMNFSNFGSFLLAARSWMRVYIYIERGTVCDISMHAYENVLHLVCVQIQ